ncbi:hypothetical protein [Geovibrio ferrireducens]|uniref:hypothetical protein n=1 Tax=Geovibrio ferrireducens TaxID=46201 RepID=UPI002247DE7E|nr:hypothetical protein [Geovibrio ferrireducens]
MKLFEYVSLNLLVMVLFLNFAVQIVKTKFIKDDAALIADLEFWVFWTGLAFYFALFFLGFFNFSLLECFLAPILSLFLYKVKFYKWIIDTVTAAMNAASAKIVELINAYRKS